MCGIAQEDDDDVCAVGYREPLQPQSPQNKKLPTLDDERLIML